MARGGDKNTRAFLLAAAAALALAQSGCQTSSIESAPSTEGDDIVGVVTGPRGAPEAGVWVIAETDDLPIAMGNGSDSIMPFVDGKFIVLRLPYPSGLFPKNVDGRIDDPKLGWKGRGIWTTSGSRTNFHNEGGKANLPKAIKLQLRPDPLAR